VQAVDLQWGINVEQVLEYHVMNRICLDAIEECQSQSAGPSFLVNATSYTVPSHDRASQTVAFTRTVWLFLFCNQPQVVKLFLALASTIIVRNRNLSGLFLSLLSLYKLL
jgi:hypothetical protein